MSFVPGSQAQTLASAVASNMANLASPVTAWQTAIAGGLLSPAALMDALLNTVPPFTLVSSFTGGWVNLNATAGEQAAYTKTLGSAVHIKGIIASGTIGSAAFTLPAGYRPIGRRQFAVNTSPNAFGMLEVNPSGAVIPQVGSATYFYLDCCFIAEQ